MTIYTVVRDVSAVVGVQLVNSLFAGIGSNRTLQEMLALANEMAQRIAYDTREWTTLKVQNTFVGDGTKTAWDLPANYKRMLLTANVWRSTSSQQPMRFIPDTDEWFQRRANNEVDAWGEWTMLGGQMLIWPALPGPIVGPPAVPAVTAKFPYIDKNCVRIHGVAGQNGDSFLNDDDTYRLDERVLKLGMIYQWKANKGSPYAEDMATYGDALQSAMGRDKPSPIIADRLPLSAAARVAYPWPSIWGPQ